MDEAFKAILEDSGVDFKIFLQINLKISSFNLQVTEGEINLKTSHPQPPQLQCLLKFSAPEEGLSPSLASAEGGVRVEKAQEGTK